MRKYLIISVSVLIILAILGFISFMILNFNENNQGQENKEKVNKVCIDDSCFNVEIARSSEERSRGLMHRESLDENSGMLFIFNEERQHSFWMKNTLIPLDIIWVNKNMKIIHMEKNVQPCEEDPCPRYKPIKPAKYVLELNSGQIDKANIKIGDALIWDRKCYNRIICK